MKAKARKSCPNCRRLQAQLDAQEARLTALEATVARLQEQLAAARKDSSTSSKPPSSDIVKPPKPPPPEGQAQRTHRWPTRTPQTRTRSPSRPRPINGGSFDYRLDLCPRCGHGLQPAPDERAPRHPAGRHPRGAAVDPRAPQSSGMVLAAARSMLQAPLPSAIERGGLVGPRLTTLIAYLKGACHASFSTIRKFLRDVVRVTISRGQLSNDHRQGERGRWSSPMRNCWTSLPDEARLNVDETGHKQNGHRQWTWCFRAGLYTLFKIDPTRSARCVDRGAGHGVRRGPGLRLLLVLSPLHASSSA